MHFCNQCSNMYYISIDPDDPNKLVYYCRNCGNIDSTISVNDVTVSKIQLKKSQQEFSHIINKYTKLDPTLPRVSNILCPNEECQTNRDTGEQLSPCLPCLPTHQSPGTSAMSKSGIVKQLS